MRVYIYPSDHSRRATMVIDCTKLTKAEARVPGNVDLEHLLPGMVLRPAEGRKPNRAIAYVVEAVRKKGEWVITFKNVKAGLPEDALSPLELPETEL